MATELKTGTAVRITVGPFLDKTDGITPEVALTATNEHLTLMVDTAGVPTLVLDANATASGGNNDMVHVTNDDAGYYDLELTAAQLNYLGNAKLSINYVTDHLPVFHEINIVSAQYWDAKYGAGNFSADVKAVNAIASTSVTTVSAYQGTTQPVNFTGTGATAYAKADIVDILGTAISTPATAGILDTNVKNIANAVVNTATAQVGANIVSQANIDFGALQKTSLNAATPASVQNIPATGTGLTAIPWNASWDAEVQSEVNDEMVLQNLDHLLKVAAVAGDAVDSSIIARLTSKSATPSFASFDNTTDALEANRDNIGTTGAAMTIAAVTGAVGSVGTGGITAASIADAAIDMATFAADIKTGSALKANVETITAGAITAAAIATNAIDADALAADAVAEIWDHAGSITSLGVEVLLERLYEMVNNKMIVTEATGVVALRNIVDSANVATGVVADLGATTQRDGLAWV
jgi:hypothetical protein